MHETIDPIDAPPNIPTAARIVSHTEIETAITESHGKTQTLRAIAIFQKIRAEIESAKLSLGTSAKARTERGKAVRGAIDTRRGGAEWRKAVFSVRCLPEIPATIKRLAAAKEMSVAEWFEAVIEAEARKGD